MEGGCSEYREKGKVDIQVNSWSQGEKMRSLPSDWWMGSVEATGALEESDWMTDSVKDVCLVAYLLRVVGHVGFEVGVEEAELVTEDKEH